MKLQFRHSLAAVLVLGFVIAGGVSATKLLARGHKGKRSKPPVMTEVALSGTVEAVLPNALTVKIDKAKPSGKSSKSKSSANVSSDQDDATTMDCSYIECTYSKGKKKRPKDSGVWTVYPKPKTAVLVEGTSTIDYLRPGQTVEFTGNLSGDTVISTVDKINVVPKHGHNLNIGGGPGLAKDEDNLKQTSLDSANTSITARIQNVKETALVVWVGERTLHLTLTASPSVHVESDNPKLITVGSKITFTGQGMHGPNLCQADTIKVTLAAPLTAKKLPESDFKLPTDQDKADLPKIADEQSDSSDAASDGTGDTEKPKTGDAEKPKTGDGAK